MGQLLSLPRHPQNSSPLRVEGSAALRCQGSQLNRIIPGALHQVWAFQEPAPSVLKSPEAGGGWGRPEGTVQA